MKEQFLELATKVPFGHYLQNDYILSLFIIIVAMGLAKLILFIFSKYLQKFAKKTKTELDDLIFEKTKMPVFYLILAYGFKLALLNLNINGKISGLVNSIMVIVFLFIILRTFDVIIGTWGSKLAKKTRTKVDEVLLPLFHKSARVVIIIVGLLWILNIWGVDITPYLAGVGISGIVLGLALQDSLRNVLGGVFLIMDKNFNINDPVRLESGELGTIKEIGLRSTKMLSYDNEVIFVPNGQLANMRIRNYVKPDRSIRKIVHFEVGYGTDPEKVKKIVLGVLKKLKNIHTKPYLDCIFTEMGESGLKFQARFWTDWDHAYNLWLEATQKIYLALEKANIDIPYPTRTIHMKQNN
tara:strand:+ start:1927 stop:2988 length:1062 start_codon:yes stop_codon:yes gene_type:complete